MRTLSLALLFLATKTVAAQPMPVSYKRDIRPILVKHCLKCHGPKKQESGLRVDSRKSLLRGGDSGEPAIAPFKPKKSLLLTAVGGKDPDLKMPPKGPKLHILHYSLLKLWILKGAKMDAEATVEKHWSLQPIRKVIPPKIKDPWIANPIDAFVMDRLRKSGLSVSKPAASETFLRRIHLVMHGMPPEPRAVKEVLADKKLNVPLVIDNVLKSPRYGERWAQHWLDVIRWAETWGFETNNPRANAWQYRDWVIRALNRDMPYDQFVKAQIVGDKMGHDAATGFLVSGPANLPGQIGKDEQSMRQARQDELDEVIRTVGSGFLGLTIGCARCHSHKFDPISQRDYYSMQAVFAGLRYGTRRERGLTNDEWTAQVPAAKTRVKQLTRKIEQLRKQLKLKPAITPGKQVDAFKPILAEAIRVWIKATHSGKAASIYELQALTAGDKPINVAAAKRGSRASASSFALENQTRHPENLIDGLWSNDGRWPWIANKDGPSWVQVEFGKAQRIDRIIWETGFRGTPVDYQIEVRVAGKWQQVVDSRDRMLWINDQRKAAEVRLKAAGSKAVGNVVGSIAKLRAARRERDRLIGGPQVFAGRFTSPTQTWRLYRGDVMQRREQTVPNVPTVLGDLKLKQATGESARRAALARHIVDPRNPLTARVMVNRIWQHHFGTGLVDTPSDFGRMGSKPSYPQLLDWLAAEFIRSRWSIKHVHRLILSSSTFRQSSRPRVQALKKDAQSRLLWRFPPRRLEAEAIRDSILAISGKLNPKMYGEGFDFFNQKGGLADYKSKRTFGPDGWRRMVYATKVRMQRVDIFGLLDCPDSGQMTPRRTRSITPVQALSLFNSDFVLRQSEFMAKRIRKAAGENVNRQIDLAGNLAFSRSLDENEKKILKDLVDKHGLTQACRVLFNANEFLWLQ